MTIPCYSKLTQQFEKYDLGLDSFAHVEHVQVAFEMLHRYGFLDACTRYASAIHSIATRAGAPDKFNVTITLAFLSLIAERIYKTDCADFDSLLAQNADLRSSRVLGKWYSKDELMSDFARTHFLLPNKAAC